MHSKLTVLLLASALGACSYKPGVDLADRGMEPINVPVVERSNFAVDVAAPGGTLLAGEAERLTGWFDALGVGYGDSIYVDGAYSETSRADIAAIAGHYGILVEPGAPVTAGPISEGKVRVIVSRARASVPNCPNWSRPAQPNYNNRSFSNFGCGVNTNLAAMIANPDDLLHGREGSGVIDPQTGAKALSTYRSKAPTGAGGLTAVSSKGN